MKAEQAKRLTEEHLHRLAQALEAGHSQTLRDYLAVMARFPRYSFRNQLLIASQRPDATRIAGFQTWRHLGRWVKRGEKGIVIVAPLPLRRAEPAQGEDPDPLLLFKAVYVFDVSQTDGEPLPELAATQGDPADHLVRLKAAITDRGIRLRYCDDLDGADGASGGGRGSRRGRSSRCSCTSLRTNSCTRGSAASRSPSACASWRPRQWRTWSPRPSA